LEFD